MTGRWQRQLVVTVSVEPDDPSVVGATGAYRSLDGLGRFHELCRRYAVRPTYLLAYSAAAEPRCVELLRACGGEAELGAHLHPEEVPPIAEAERGNHTLRPSDVEPSRLQAKVRNLVERIAEATGRRPTSYRAGFFDLTPAQAAALIELGIEADSSLGPLERTRDGHSLLRTPFEPYVVDPKDVCRPLHSDCRLPIADRRLKSGLGERESQTHVLVEVPMTSVFRHPFPRLLILPWLRLPGPVRGALRRAGVADLLRFRPAAASAEGLLAICRRTERLGLPAVMTIHSNELAAGTSTSVRTEADLAAYFARLERVFAYTHENHWSSLTLAQVARATAQVSAPGPNPQSAMRNPQSPHVSRLTRHAPGGSA